MKNETVKELREAFEMKDEILNYLREAIIKKLSIKEEQQISRKDETTEYMKKLVLKNFGIHGDKISLMYLNTSTIQIEEAVEKTFNSEGKIIMNDHYYLWGVIENNIYRRLGGFSYKENKDGSTTVTPYRIY